MLRTGASWIPGLQDDHLGCGSSRFSGVWISGPRPGIGRPRPTTARTHMDEDRGSFSRTIAGTRRAIRAVYLETLAGLIEPVHA